MTWRRASCAPNWTRRSEVDVNLAVLKNGRAQAVRFSTLAAICAVLECQPSDVLRYEPDEVPHRSPAASATGHE